MTTKYFINYNYRYFNGYTWDTMTFDDKTYLLDIVKMLKAKNIEFSVSQVIYLKNNKQHIYEFFVNNGKADIDRLDDIIKIFGKKNATRLIND